MNWFSKKLSYIETKLKEALKIQRYLITVTIYKDGKIFTDHAMEGFPRKEITSTFKSVQEHIQSNLQNQDVLSGRLKVVDDN